MNEPRNDDRFNLSELVPGWYGKRAPSLRAPLKRGIDRLRSITIDAPFVIIEHRIHWDYDGPMEFITALTPFATEEAALAAVSNLADATRRQTLNTHADWHDLSPPRTPPGKYASYQILREFKNPNAPAPEIVRSFEIGNARLYASYQVRYFIVRHSNGDIVDQLLSYQMIMTELAEYLAGRQLVSERAVELASATYWWSDNLPRLAEIGGTSVAALVKLIAQQAGPHIVDFSSESLFSLAQRFSQEIFDPAEARTVLRFALDRFERILKPDDGDGDYGPDLSGGETVNGAIAGLIWAQLGNPDREDRWRATHCVRRLALFGQGELLRTLVEACRHGRADGFQTRGFPFYLHYARLHLLMAFARAAAESPGVIAEFSDFLASYANRAHLHVFERHYAGQALKSLVGYGLYEADPATVDGWNRLLDLVPRDEGAGDRGAGPAAGGQGDERPYYMPHELGKDWGIPLGRAFGFKEKAFQQAVGAAIRRHVTSTPNRIWDDDPRSKYPVYRRYQRTRLTPDGLSDYEANSGLAFLLGELLDSVPIEDEYYRERLSELLAERLPARPDGKWVSDRRDPTPVSTRKWLSEGGYSKDWTWGIESDDFHALLRSGEGHLHLAGSWVETDHYKVETIEIESALVRPETAWDILRACQFGRDASFFRLPYDHWDRRSAGLFSLTPTVSRPDRLYGIDDDDPLAGHIVFPGYEPGKVLRRMFGFAPDDQFRRWSGKGSWAGLHIRSKVWGEPRLLRDDDKPIEGQTLTIDPAALATMLATLRRSLIVGVRIYRRDSYIRDGETSYAEPYARFFFLDSDGTLGWFRGYRPAWSRFDEAA